VLAIIRIILTSITLLAVTLFYLRWVLGRRKHYIFKLRFKIQKMPTFPLNNIDFPIRRLTNLSLSVKISPKLRFY
jgi:hypothetical protein